MFEDLRHTLIYIKRIKLENIWKKSRGWIFFFFFSFLFLNKMGRAISLLRRHSRRLGSCQPTLPLPPNRSRSYIIKKQDDVHFGPALLLRRETGESRKAVHAVVCNSDRTVLMYGFYLLPISDNGKDPILKNCCCLSVVAAKFHTNPSICQWLLIGLLIEYFRAIK